jgi:hypothetical protein
VQSTILKKDRQFKIESSQKFSGTRNRIVYGYDKILDELIWSIEILKTFHNGQNFFLLKTSVDVVEEVSTINFSTLNFSTSGRYPILLYLNL